MYISPQYGIAYWYWGCNIYSAQCIHIPCYFSAVVRPNMRQAYCLLYIANDVCCMVNNDQMITGLLCCLNSSVELVYRVVILQVLRQKPSVHKSINSAGCLWRCKVFPPYAIVVKYLCCLQWRDKQLNIDKQVYH